MIKKGIIKEDEQGKIREEAKILVRNALKAASELQKPPIDDLFADVYDQLTPNLVE